MWLNDALATIAVIESLPSGWDSHGAEPIDSSVCARARDLLERLHHFGADRPHINPCPNGCIQFEWEIGRKYLELEIHASELNMYYEDRQLELSLGDVDFEYFLDCYMEYWTCE